MFAEIAEGRFNFDLKSGLLCAVMLLPATAWATSASGETGNKDASQVAMATLPSTTPPSTVPTGTEATPAQPTPAVPTAQPARPTKLVSLSRHIQNRYGITEQKANQIVGQAIDNGGRHQLDPELILAIIAVESTFRERAVSRVGLDPVAVIKDALFPIDDPPRSLGRDRITVRGTFESVDIAHRCNLCKETSFRKQ